MYETMAGWETDPSLAAQSQHMRDFAQIWQAADKVVYSKSLQTVTTARTRIERDFDTAAVEQMKASATSDRAIDVGNPRAPSLLMWSNALRAVGDAAVP